MAEHNAVYQKALYYDIIFDRDVGREVDFILDVYTRLNGRPPASALDIACGPAYHAIEIARRGLHTFGIDLQPEMIEMARQRIGSEDLPLSLFPADMRAFELPRPVDIAYIVFDGLDALLTNQDILAHLRTVARNLTPAGIYLIDLTHPRLVSLMHYSQFHYHGQRAGTTVDIHWATNHPAYDLVSNIAEVEVQITATTAGRTETLTDTARERYFSPMEIQLLADLSGCFRLAGWWGDFDLDQPLDRSQASTHIIAALQQTGRPSEITKETPA